MAERRLHGLQRVLGVNALFSTAYGNVGSSIYYALGLVASYALGLTPVVFVITGVIFYLTAATYAEATAMYPEAGGSSSFARHAFNEFASFFAAWAQMLNYTVTIAISAFFVPHYLGGVLGIDALRHGPGDIVFGIGVVVVLSLVNVLGAEESAGVNILLAVVDFLTQVLLVLVGIFLVLSPDTLVDNVSLGVAPTWTDFLLAIPVGMVAYTGIETISNMAEEAKDETKTIPAAISRVRLAVFAIYFTLPAVALSALPVTQNAEGEYTTLLGLGEEEGGFAGDPILGVVKQIDLGPLQEVGELYVGLLAATILFIATNAGIIGVSRLVYSMGIYRQVPDRLRQLHPRYGTPWVGILLFGAIACLIMLPGQATFLGNLYAFGAMLSFTIAHLAVIRLRQTQSDVERPYRGPGVLRVRGRELPLFAVLGLLGTGLAFLVTTVLHLDVAVTGFGWLALGIVLYALYRRRQGLDLTTVKKVAIPRPVIDTEAEYESVLLAVDTRTPFEGAVRAAQRLAARRRRGIHVLVTIVVPQSSPLDAELPEAELAAQAIIERARLLAGRRVTGHWEKVRPGQAGRLIVEEARTLRARAVVMPLPGRVSGGSVFGKTVETVLEERPCRVIILSEPSEAPRKPKAAA
ncbi:universal stress protein [Conexibacter sp. SYSU D00693]|uniref:amino acid permease n=1 Tax=Conexibacter sp. SYSU D00693 TaxID=2812560 RepID=UPI00196B5067|nr:universal stress protein [Conexibacter sp. SYSU D00693]